MYKNSITAPQIHRMRGAPLDHIKEQFRRITTVALESNFMQKLEEYKLLDLFESKGGAVKADMQKILEVVYGLHSSSSSLVCYFWGVFTQDADDTMI
ncbi:unnamed protein product [Coregonus sp. 'balchen']|nr:unnamed protein product [Coregonus sp. 'balchen']